LSQTIEGDQVEGIRDVGHGRLDQMQRERPYGSIPVDDGGGDAEHLALEQEHLRQSERARPPGSSHVDEGGGVGYRLDQGDQEDLTMGAVTQDRSSGVVRSSPEIDRQ
jgi:hypothetical protein